MEEREHEHDLHFVHDSEGEGTPRHSRRSNRKKAVRISWIGNPVYIEDGNKFYHAVRVDNITYYLKEYIRVPIIAESIRRNPIRGTRNDTEKYSYTQSTMIIGKITRLWETEEAETMCQLNSLLSDPEDARGGRRPYHGPKELVEKEGVHELCIPLHSLFPGVHKNSVKIAVESFEDFSRRKHFPDDVYHYIEKFLEPKIEVESSTLLAEGDVEETECTNSKPIKKISHKEAEEPEPQGSWVFDVEMDSVATPSPSKRKNRRVISDDADYIAVKQEYFQPGDKDKPLRRLKRMKDLDNDTEPNIEDPSELVSTPRKRKRTITDSAEANMIFFGEDYNTARRSARIPKLQQKRHEKIRNIIAMTNSSDRGGSDDDLGHTAVDEATTEDNSATEQIQSEKHGSDSDVVDVTVDFSSTMENTTVLHNLRKTPTKQPTDKNNMSWIEMSEQGKLAVPAVKLPLKFDTSKTTELPSRLKSSRQARQTNINTFMAQRANTTAFINLVEDNEEKSETSDVRAQEKDKNKKRDETTKHSRKERNRGYGTSFIPQLMFNDNDVDNDIQQHIKQQRLLHEVSRHSSAIRDEDEGGRGRWKTKRNKPNPIEDEESEPENGNGSEYEDDDFLVADDAPIETEIPSQDELGDEDSSHEGYEDDSSAIVKNDQDGLFEHVFTNKQAFIVFLQYMISACVDPDFIPLMVDSEDTDTYFKPALRKIRDLIQSRKSSLVSSSAWDAAFKEDLESRPYLSSWTTQNVNLDDCQACLRTNHPASFKTCLSGPRFNIEQYSTNNNLLDLPTLPEENDEGEDTYLLVRQQNTTPTFSEELVQTLLNNSSWITEMTDRFSNLLLEADEFRNDSHEIM